MAPKLTVASLAQTVADQSAKLDALIALMTAQATPAPVATVAAPTPQTEATPARQRAARRQNRAKNPQATSTQTERFPKAPTGAVIGTVERTARRGYGLLVKTENGSVWLNAPMSGPAVFTDYAVGQAVSFVSKNDFGSIETGAAVAAPSATPATVTPARQPRATQTAALVATPPAAPVTATVKPAVTDGCPFCGVKHFKYSQSQITSECLKTQFARETGAIFEDANVGSILAYAAWLPTAPTRTVYSYNTPTKSLVVSAGATTATVAPPSTPVAPPSTPVAPIATETPKAPKVTDGAHIVTIAQFPKTAGRQMVKVHSTNFLGNDGTGQWLDKMTSAAYDTVIKLAVNDRIKVTLKDGTCQKVKLVSSVASDTGVVPGIEKSGRDAAPVQISGKTPADTRKEAQNAAKKAARKAALRSI